LIQQQPRNRAANVTRPTRHKNLQLGLRSSPDHCLQKATTARFSAMNWFSFIFTRLHTMEFLHTFLPAKEKLSQPHARPPDSISGNIVVAGIQLLLQFHKKA
jgi:hypothetical protein